jgi:hypothetical protein
MDDNLKEARGIALGVFVSLILWVAIIGFLLYFF